MGRYNVRKNINIHFNAFLHKIIRLVILPRLYDLLILFIFSFILDIHPSSLLPSGI